MVVSVGPPSAGPAAPESAYPASELLRSTQLVQASSHTSASRPRHLEHRGRTGVLSWLKAHGPETGASFERLCFAPSLRSWPALANLSTQFLRATAQAHPRSHASPYPGSARAHSLRAEAARPRR